jgi:type IV secretion system protein VirB9
MTPRTLLLAVALCLAGSGAMAASVAPQPGAGDSRVRFVDYGPDQVVVITAYLGFQLMVEFGADERIENVAIGDSSGWQITPNRKANLLFIKPLSPLAATNLTVVTDQRRYLFDLAAATDGAAAGAPDLAYAVRFHYAKAEPDSAQPVQSNVRINRAYAVSGAKALIPKQVFDDGRFTYFEWPHDAPIPAIFVANAEGGESVVNYGVREGLVAVEQVASRFVLRAGRQTAAVVNKAPAPGGSEAAR